MHFYTSIGSVLPFFVHGHELPYLSLLSYLKMQRKVIKEKNK